MQTTLSKFTTFMFFITLINIQFTSTFELSSISYLPKSKTLKSFRGECSYYELKENVVKINFLKKITLLVNTCTQQIKDLDVNDITIKQFKKVFKNCGNYGKVATDLAESDDYVKSYFKYFSKKNGKMSIKELTQFMALYHLEGELLVEGNHPILTKFFSNEHEVSKRKACPIAKAYWELVNNSLKKIYLKFQWSDFTSITKKEIFETLVNTVTGKCWVKAQPAKDCKFFDDFVSKALGFFNTSSGKKRGLTADEAKLAFSTFLFKDISVKTCKGKFDPMLMEQKIQALLRMLL